MTFGLRGSSGGNGNGGDFMTYVKYDATSGRMWRPDRVMDDAGKYVNHDEDITSGFLALFDLENIQVGWIMYPSGAAPVKHLVRLNEDPGEKPGPKFGESFQFRIKLDKSCAGPDAEKRVREFASSAGCVRETIAKVYEKYQDGMKANPGKLPVVALKGTSVIEVTGGGTKKKLFVPNWEIVNWAPRPDDLQAPEVVSATPNVATTPPATGATRAAPPPQQAASASDFG